MFIRFQFHSTVSYFIDLFLKIDSNSDRLSPKTMINYIYIDKQLNDILLLQ
jgi:hypothetical protein